MGGGRKGGGGVEGKEGGGGGGRGEGGKEGGRGGGGGGGERKEGAREPTKKGSSDTRTPGREGWGQGGCKGRKRRDLRAETSEVRWGTYSVCARCVPLRVRLWDGVFRQRRRASRHSCVSLPVTPLRWRRPARQGHMASVNLIPPRVFSRRGGSHQMCFSFSRACEKSQRSRALDIALLQ